MQRRTFIYTFALGSGGLLLNGLKTNAMKPNGDHTLIRIIYNNTGECEGLTNSWGFSAWIENREAPLLFDAGGKGEILEQNMSYLGLDPGKLKKIVISHDHWDHFGGLEKILTKTREKPELYVTANTARAYADKFPNATVKSVSDPVRITDHIWSTGSLKTTYKGKELHEHSLLITHNNTMVLLTGCSHPGIANITEAAKSVFPEKRLLLVAGGFHLAFKRAARVKEISERLKELGVEKIAPSHCTGNSAIKTFRHEWGANFTDLNIGDTFEV
jgi:7,8-dihydropterin-6-yl-methyl-4-(beta-D-ribofuranosyl)aminobenzene 5'-phosphate synthase